MAAARLGCETAGPDAPKGEELQLQPGLQAGEGRKRHSPVAPLPP